MIKHNPSKSIRAAAAFAVAAVLAAAASASAQTIDTDIFGGDNGSNPTTLSVASLVGVNQSATGPFGPGFTGTVALDVGAGTTLGERLNVNGNGRFVVGETGLAGLAGTFSATKTFADATFIAGQFYQFTLTRTTASAVNLLSATNVMLTTTSGNTTTTVVDTSTGTGLIGVVNLVNLFGTSNTATFTFQAPANVNATSPITFNINGGLTASALNSTFVFSNASLVAVPEPSTTAATCAGMLGLGMVVFRRRLA